MTSATLTRTVLVSAGVGLTCLAAGAIPVMATAIPVQPAKAHVTAHVNPVTTWQRVSAGTRGIGNSDQPSVLRSVVSGKPYLFTVWHRQDGPNVESIRSRLIASNGSLLAPQVAVGGWGGPIVADPTLLATPSGPSVVFGGKHSTNPGELYAGHLSVADWNSTWALNSNSFSHSGDASDSVGTAAIRYGGQQYSAFTSLLGDINIHAGSEAGNPADYYNTFTSDTVVSDPGANTYHTAFAVDPATNKLWLAWYALNSHTASNNGIRYQQLLPTASAIASAPASHDAAGHSIDPDQRLALTGVPTGPWVAYTSGYPNGRGIKLFNLRTHRLVTVPSSANSDQVGLVPGPGGRLWVFWSTQGFPLVHAVRTNAAITAFEPVQTVATPDDVFATAGEGTPGPLDLVINSTVSLGSSDNEMFYRRFLARFAASASYKRGVVTVGVTDAGTPVAGATVTYGGHSVKTNAKGVGAIFVGGTPGVRKITVTDAGYWGTVLSVRVR